MATIEINNHSKEMTPKVTNGFTLIELLIALAIISVLALMLYPNYTSSTRKAKRSDAIKSIQQISNRLEKFMTYCNTYTEQFGGAISENASHARCSGLGINTINDLNINSENNYYSLKITCADNCMTYQVDATAQGGQLKDSNCQIFTYSSRGLKTSTNASGQASVDACWK